MAVDVPVPVESPDCPRCGASVEVVEQPASVEDILPQRVHTIRCFRVDEARCRVYGGNGRGLHIGLAAGQGGASAHRTGPDVMAQALTLHYHLGRPLSKVPEQNLSAVEKTKNGRARAFSGDLKATLREVIKVWQECRAGTCGLETYRERGSRFRQRLDHQLCDRRLKDTDHQRLLDGIGRRHDRGRVLLFPMHPEIEPTKNRAERGLRGAVFARKVSHCSKNERGAQTYEAMKSVTATLALRGQSVAGALADLIKGMPVSVDVVRQSITQKRYLF
jgi:hypothetical protein